MVALAADRWREDQKNAELADEYIGRLAEDVRVDLADYAETVAWSRLADSEVLYVLDVYRGLKVERTDHDRFVGAVMRASWGQRPRHPPQTRNDLISTGNTGLLPIEVRTAMNAYYGDVDLYDQRMTLSLSSCFESYWVAVGRILGPELSPHVWRTIERSPDHQIQSGSIGVEPEAAQAVVARLRAENGLEGVFGKVRHCLAQRIAINEDRLPRVANELLQVLETYQ